MIAGLPRADVPEWLDAGTAEDICHMRFPLEAVLHGSLYYPASGFHGDPIAYLAGNFWSFIYVDYAFDESRLEAELRNEGFLGYHLLSRRNVSQQELTPRGWVPPPLLPGDAHPRHRPQHKPYCVWVILERDPDRTSEHGPHRFSLMYLCADGVAAFDALYRSNHMAPGAVAVIQPGTGFGGNWTGFEDPDAIFHRFVSTNPAGQPDILLYGGSGGRDHYQKPCWPEYSRDFGFLGNTGIHVWSRN